MTKAKKPAKKTVKPTVRKKTPVPGLKFFLVIAALGFLIINSASIKKELPIAGQEARVVKSTTPRKAGPSPSLTPIKEPLEKGIQKTSGETVLNNDSYWKISKRHCGTGKFYLSIRDQNGGKPLYKEDFVEVSCSL